MVCVQRLGAHVTLDDPQPILEAAKDRAVAGDESWKRWVAEYHRGEAIIVRLTVTLQIGGGAQDIIETANRGVFLETNPHPPRIEQQVAELVGKDFPVLARELTIRGHPTDASDLRDMYVHVELGEDVRRSLLQAGARHTPPDSDARLSRHQGPAS